MVNQNLLTQYAKHKNCPVENIEFDSFNDLLEYTNFLEQLQGEFKNRHIEPLPSHKCNLYIITTNEETMHLCEWIPAQPPTNTGWLGTARVIETKYQGIGFHAWRQNDQEFIYYKIV